MESDLLDMKDASAEEFKELENVALSLIESILSKNPPQNSDIEDNLVENENPDAKYWLSTIINQYSEKIKADQILIRKQQQQLQELQMSILNFEEQNSFLKDMYEDAQGKMNQLQSFLDESEANNEALQEKVFRFESRCNQLEALKEPTKKLPLRSASVNSNLIPSDAAALVSKKFQEEIEGKKVQIETLQETVELQEGLIEKLQVDVGRYIDLEEKYEQLKKDLSYLLSLKVQNDEINTELMAFTEKLGFDRKSISLQNEPTSRDGNKILIEDRNQETYPVDSSDEGENLNLLAKGQSFSPSQSKSFRRQKSLAEDLRSTKVSEEFRGVSPFNKSRGFRQKLASQSNDFTSSLKDGLQGGHKHTKTVSTFETDGFTPELRSPDNNIIESDIEEDFFDGLENNQNLSNDNSRSVRGKALMRWLDEADPKISEKDVESPISVKSRQTVESDENIEKVHRNPKMIATVPDAKIKSMMMFSENLVVSDFRNNKLAKIESGRTLEIVQQRKKDLTEEISLYIQKEKGNARKNTKLSVFALLKVMVLGSRYEK